MKETFQEVVYLLITPLQLGLDSYLYATDNISIKELYIIYTKCYLTSLNMSW